MAHLYNRRSYSAAVWVDFYGGPLPHNAVVGGNESNGETIFVGRALYNGDTIPGKIVPSHGVCYVPAPSQEVGQRSYQVLINPAGTKLQWVWCDGNQIPSGALIGGEEKDGTVLYIGRTRHHSGSMAVGKFSMLTKHFYYPFGGAEHSSKTCEILVAADLTPN